MDTTSSATGQHAATWAWLALVVITIGSWWLAPAHSGGTAHASAPITGVQWHPEHPSVSLTQLTRLLRRLERQSLATPFSRRSA